METQTKTIKPGQEWINTTTNMLYLVVGFSKPANSNQYTEILYRSHDMPAGFYLHTPATEWFKRDRNGYPAFLPYYLLSQNQLLVIRSVATDPQNEFVLIKETLLEIFEGSKS